MKNKNRVIRKQTQFAIRKLSIGAASVLISTGIYVGTKSTTASAATISNDNSEIQVDKNITPNSSSDSQTTEAGVSQNPGQSSSDSVTNSQETESLKSAPVYTTQNTVPELNVSNMFSDEQLQEAGIDQYDENTKVSWQKEPDVSKIGNTSGIADLTYSDMNGDSETSELKNLTVNVPVLVRKADQEVKKNQVENSLNIINSSDNSLVAHYNWVGTKATSETEDSNQIPDADNFETNLSSMLQYLGFENDEGSDFPYDITTFGSSNKTATMFVHPVTDVPAISDSPYFMEGRGDSTIDNVTQTPDPASYLSNLGSLPVGTKIEWKVAPTYDYAKDEDGNYINYEPTNDPSIEVTLPGKDPIILDGETLKEVASLPAYGDGSLLINSNNELALGQTANSPTAYITNLDSFIKNYLEQDGEEVTDSAINEFKHSFKWTTQPLTSQAGYTFGMMEYGDGVTGIPVLFKVNPTSVDNHKEVTRTITYSGLSEDLLPENQKQIVTFTQQGQQTYVDEPIEWKSNNTTWDAVKVDEIKDGNVTYKPFITIDGKPVSSIDEVKDLTQNSPDVKVLVQYQGSGNGDVVTTPTQNPLVVVIYQTKDGKDIKTIKTDSYEGKVGDKVDFNVPKGYVPVDDLPDVTITSDIKPITVTITKKASSNGEVVTAPTKNPLVVVTYKTKDGEVVKTDSYEGQVGDKVKFTVPDGYVPVKSLPDVTIMSDIKPITVTITKKESSNGDVVTAPTKNPLVVVTYKTKDDEVVKTDSYEGQVGDKVDFNVPKGYVSVDDLPDVTITSDIKPIIISVAKKVSSNGEVVTAPTKNPLVVVTYKTKDGEVVKTDNYEGKIGDKVKFNIPEGYTPVKGLPSTTITSDLAPITIIVAKKESSNGEVVTAPTKNPLVVVTYTTKDGEVVKADSYEGQVGNKVNFDIPEGYTPVEGLPDITITSGIKPITIIVTKVENNTGDVTPVPTNPGDNNKPTKDTNSVPIKDPSHNTNINNEIPKKEINNSKPESHASNVPNKKVSTVSILSSKARNESNIKIKTQKINFTPQTVNSIKSKSALAKNTGNHTSQAHLPQTGSKMAAVLLGLASLTGSIVLAFISKKRKI